MGLITNKKQAPKTAYPQQGAWACGGRAGLGDFEIWCWLRVVNGAISFETSLLSHSKCLCFSVSTFLSFPLNLILHDLTLCFFCALHSQSWHYSFSVFRALKSVFHCNKQEQSLRFPARILHSLSPVSVCSFILL